MALNKEILNMKLKNIIKERNPMHAQIKTNKISHSIKIKITLTHKRRTCCNGSAGV